MVGCLFVCLLSSVLVLFVLLVVGGSSHWSPGSMADGLWFVVGVEPGSTVQALRAVATCWQCRPTLSASESHFKPSIAYAVFGSSCRATVRAQR